MRAHLAMPADLRDDYLQCGFEPAEPGTAPAVVTTGPVAADWPATLDQLTGVFRAAKAATAAEAAVVFVVELDDLLGRSGPTAAMAACGIVSASRTLAAETRRAGIPVNTIAAATDVPLATVAHWCRELLAGGVGAPTGELVHLGGSQIGKALS